MYNIENIKAVLEKYGKYIISLFFIIILFFIIKQYFYYREIKVNQKETIGLIEKMEYDSRGSYSLYYNYNVNGVNYKNTIGTSGFYGYNKKKGCVGCEFKVFYSSKNPNKSSIRLGKYENYKTTVEFGLFDE